MVKIDIDPDVFEKVKIAAVIAWFVGIWYVEKHYGEFAAVGLLFAPLIVWGVIKKYSDKAKFEKAHARAVQDNFKKPFSEYYQD